MIRRDFLKLSVAVTPAMALALNACRTGAATPQEALAQPESLYGIMERNDLQAVGKAYLARFNPTKEALQTEILGQDPAPGTDPAKVINQIADTVRNDFNNGRTIILEGWVLSLTEARQCALHTLIYK
jgi:FKBP-type peptidyl-prolyl cis-trans isomerase 2